MPERSLSLQQKRFAEVFAETNDAVAAYIAAYGQEKANRVKYLSSTAAHKLNDPKIKSLIEEIQQGLRAQYVMLAPDALNNLVELANNAESEKVKLEANKEILYGAGLKPPEQIEMKHIGIFGTASIEDIRNQIRNYIESDIVDTDSKSSEGPNGTS